MFKEGAIKLGIAPIGWTNDDMPELGAENTFEQSISEMALAGFTGTEVGNKYPKQPEVLQKHLNLRKLQVASAWFSAYLTTQPYEKIAESFVEHRDFLWEVGAKVIVVSEQGHSIQGNIQEALFKNKPIFNEREWGLLSEGLNKLGALAKEKNMKLVYHHHMGTGVQTTEEIDKLMSLTNQDLVYLLYDTGHLYFSGENLEHILLKYIDRIKHIHLKDVREDVAKQVKQDDLSFLTGVREGVFTVPGDGVIDFQPLFEIIAISNYKGWMVVEAEQDPAKANPLAYAIKARQFIRKQTNL